MKVRAVGDNFQLYNIYPPGPSPCLLISKAADQLWSSKSCEFHPRFPCSLHFQLELVTSPMLKEPSIPGLAWPVAATAITLALPGMTKLVVFSLAYPIGKQFHGVSTSECCCEIWNRKNEKCTMFFIP